MAKAVFLGFGWDMRTLWF